MQTTLCIDDRLYREAKAEAARAGVSLTRFLEDGLRLRLEKRLPESAAPHAFRTYAAATTDSRSWEELVKYANGKKVKIRDWVGAGYVFTLLFLDCADGGFQIDRRRFTEPSRFVRRAG